MPASTMAPTPSPSTLSFVPRNCNVLSVGPRGPHTTGGLVISIGEPRGGRCFSIVLAPRIVKIFGTENMRDAYDRYIRHIFDQAKAIVQHQKIGVMFCTSRLLDLLPEHLDTQLFSGLKAIVHAGTTMEPDVNRILQEQYFPGIPIVGI